MLDIFVCITLLDCIHRVCAYKDITIRSIDRSSNYPEWGCGIGEYQHMITRGILRQVLTELGALPKLHTLSLELRLP